MFRSQNLDKALSINGLRLIFFKLVEGNLYYCKASLLAHADHKRESYCLGMNQLLVSSLVASRRSIHQQIQDLLPQVQY